MWPLAAQLRAVWDTAAGRTGDLFYLFRLSDLRGQRIAIVKRNASRGSL